MVPSHETITAPPAWRAISPVSRVTVWLPYWKLLLIFATLWSPWDVVVRLRNGAPLRALHRGAMRECGVAAFFQRAGFNAGQTACRKKEPRRIAAPRWVFRSATQAQFLDQRLVTLRILLVQVIEQAATA